MSGTSKTPRNRKIVEHVNAMAEHSQNPVKYLEALARMVNDPGMGPAQKEAIFKTMAQEQAALLNFAFTGHLVTIDEVAELRRKAAEQATPTPAAAR